MSKKPQRPKLARTPRANQKPTEVVLHDDSKPLPRPQPLSLNPFHQLLTNLFSDMLLGQPDREDLEDMLWAMCSHWWRNYVPGHIAAMCPDQRRDEINGMCSKRVPEWMRKVNDLRPARLVRPQSEKEPPTAPASVTERMRQNIREDLEWRFEWFIAQAIPEELYLMQAIMMTWDSNSHASDHEPAEIALASAFSAEIGEHSEYLLVPSEHSELVQEYIELLNKRKAA